MGSVTHPCPLPSNIKVENAFFFSLFFLFRHRKCQAPATETRGRVFFGSSFGVVVVVGVCATFHPSLSVGCFPPIVFPFLIGREDVPTPRHPRPHSPGPSSCKMVACMVIQKGDGMGCLWKAYVVGFVNDSEEKKVLSLRGKKKRIFENLVVLV